MAFDNEATIRSTTKGDELKMSETMIVEVAASGLVTVRVKPAPGHNADVVRACLRTALHWAELQATTQAEGTDDRARWGGIVECIKATLDSAN